jgi:hypothetical protein
LLLNIFEGRNLRGTPGFPRDHPCGDLPILRIQRRREIFLRVRTSGDLPIPRIQRQRDWLMRKAQNTLKYQTMDKAQKLSDPERYVPSPEPFRIE